MAFKTHSVAIGVLAMFALAASACAGLRVHSFTERDVEFGRYRTYKFAPGELRSTGDPRLDGNRFFAERIQADVDDMLKARGYEKTTNPRADVLVHYHASVSQEIELNEGRNDCVPLTVTSATANSVPDNCRPYIYDAGTLLIDLVDGRSNKLLWRGWAEGAIDGVIADQRALEQRVDESVRRILEKLPRSQT